MEAIVLFVMYATKTPGHWYTTEIFPLFYTSVIIFHTTETLWLQILILKTTNEALRLF